VLKRHAGGETGTCAEIDDLPGRFTLSVNDREHIAPDTGQLVVDLRMDIVVAIRAQDMEDAIDLDHQLGDWLGRAVGG